MGQHKECARILAHIYNGNVEQVSYWMWRQTEMKMTVHLVRISWRMFNSVQSKAASSSVGSSRRGPRLTKRMFALPAVANRLYEDGFNSVRRINSLLCVSRHGNRLRVQGVFLSETDNPEFPSFRGYQTQSFHWTCFLKQTPLVV